MKLHECKGCRRRKELVINVAGMGYCEGCKDRAPTKKEAAEFFRPRDERPWIDHDIRYRFGSKTNVDKE